MVSKISEFNILLNDLSSELDQANLRSLMHVCRELIPGGQRETIRSGLDVFSILLHRNAIGEDPPKMAYLLRIIKQLRPKRRDLVNMVKSHIKHNYEAPEEILDDVDSSSDGYAISRSSTPVVMDHNECCAARCCCLNCVCIPCCSAFSCCLLLTVSFIFLVVMASVFWYTRHFPSVYNYLHSKDDLKDAGPVVIGILAFFTICSVLSVIYTSVKKGRKGRRKLKDKKIFRLLTVPHVSVKLPRSCACVTGGHPGAKCSESSGDDHECQIHIRGGEWSGRVFSLPSSHRYKRRLPPPR